MTRLEHMEDKFQQKLLLIDDGLERAQVKADALEQSVPAVTFLEYLVVILAILTCIVVGFLAAISWQLMTEEVTSAGPFKPHVVAQKTVLRALGLTVKRVQPKAEVRGAVFDVVQQFPDRAREDGAAPQVSMEALEGIRGTEGLTGTFTGALGAWDVRIRQRARGCAVGTAAESGVVPAELRALMKPDGQPDTLPLPDRAANAWSLLQDTFSDPDDLRAVSVALRMAAAALPSERWRFKEAILNRLVRLGADARAVTALLLHDLDDCLGLPWATIAQAMANCKALGEEVMTVIGEKKRLEQLGLLLYLRSMAQESSHGRQGSEWPAAMQLLRMLYLKQSQDFRAALVEIAEMEHMLWDVFRNSSEWETQESSLQGRAMASCALDLHAPLAHGLGLDALGSSGSSKSRNERLSPSLEGLALRLRFPDEYRGIEDWMLQEGGLLNRTLQRCTREVRKALDKDPDFTALASFHVNGRVKSVYSLVKKLLRQRGGAFVDLKAEAVKDLLALEVIVSPDPMVEVPENPEWLAEEWRERAACFAALDALQRYAQETPGWDILPQSTKDYITKSKKSGYRALHITLKTNVSAYLPSASSRAFQQARVSCMMPCKLEVHIFSASMKKKERFGSASHHLYKAFELTSQEVFEAIGKGAADSLSPRELRGIVFPAEKLQLWGEVFSPSYVDTEFDALCANSDYNLDGRLSFGDVSHTQKHVASKLEEFRGALEQHQQGWWVYGVHTPDLARPQVTWNHGIFHGSNASEKAGVIERALEVIKTAHQGQVRKSGEPFWTHPLSVADCLARLLLAPVPDMVPAPRIDCAAEELEESCRGLWHQVASAPEDVFTMYIAALLHDTVEDTPMTVARIQTMFGPSVASLVDGVTKASSARSSRASRSAQDLRKVLERAAQDVRVLIIKFSDRLHNMRTLEHMQPDKQRRIAEETRAVYVPLAERLGIHVWKTELDELCCRYLNGYAYELTVAHNRQTLVARRRNLRYIQQYFSTLIVEWLTDGSIVKIQMEEESLHTQLHRWSHRPGGAPPTPVPRVHIVTKDKDMCWSCLGRIHALLPPMPGRLKDYLSSPKENLYHSLHTAVLMDGAPVEVYIKSLEMDWVADFGVGAYWRHNEELQRSGMGRQLQEALLSTWLLEASDSLEQTLRSVEVHSVEEAASTRKAEEHLVREEEALQHDLRPLLERVVRVACGCSASSSDHGAASSRCAGVAEAFARSSAKGAEQLGSMHRAYREALREKVTVFTPTGRVVYLPRDATALDFAIWNLGARKGFRAESAMIDGCPASLHTRLSEGQTVLVHLDGAPLPPLKWAGMHLRYLRTPRARAALLEQRAELMSREMAVEEGRKATREELLLHSLDLGLLEALGDDVFAAVGQGTLPAELVSAQLLAVRLDLPLGDPGCEYAAESESRQRHSRSNGSGAATPAAERGGSAEAGGSEVSFLLVAEDRAGLMSEVVEVMHRHGLHMKRLNVDPLGRGRCRLVGSIVVDCALCFGSLMHSIREFAQPLLLERLPVELAGRSAPGQPRQPLGPWLQEAPEALAGEPLDKWKMEALRFAVNPCQKLEDALQPPAVGPTPAAAPIAPAAKLQMPVAGTMPAGPVALPAANQQSPAVRPDPVAGLTASTANL